MLGTLTLAYRWTKSSNTKACFIIKYYIFYLLNIIFKVENRMVVWVQNGFKCVGCYPYDYVADWELLLVAAAQHHEKLQQCMLLAQENVRIQNLNMYHSHTIAKVKNPKSNHHY